MKARVGPLAASDAQTNTVDLGGLLTPEQRTFAEIVGQEIARYWRASRHAAEKKALKKMDTDADRPRHDP